MTMFTIRIDRLEEAYECASDQTLLAGMERLGKRGIPVGCRGGGCGVCKVQITAGDYQCKKMSRAHVTAEEQQAGFALACRCHPLSDVSITVVGQMRGALTNKSKPSSRDEAVHNDGKQS